MLPVVTSFLPTCWWKLQEVLSVVPLAEIVQNRAKRYRDDLLTPLSRQRSHDHNRLKPCPCSSRHQDGGAYELLSRKQMSRDTNERMTVLAASADGGKKAPIRNFL